VHRFFAPTLDAGDELVTLPREEAEHLTRVLRLSAGDTVAVFDGRGHEFLARVSSAARRDVRLLLVSPIAPAAEPVVAITLVPAVLKADKMDGVVRDAVMLGVAAIQPIVTARAETTVAALLRGARVDRWRRIALTSAKQSGRAVLPEIRMPLTFETWLSEPQPELAVMLVEPRAAANGDTLAVFHGQKTPSDAAVLVGPEGGWAEPEWRQAAERGIRLVTLGQRTLRADAIPIAALSVLQFLWNDL
jgi:16S rRNA (uracil1498-N3)-methyltransferase